MAQFKLKKDVVIPAGTVFNCVDGEKREYVSGNYSCLHGISDNTCGEFIHGAIGDFPEEDSEWFEELE